MDRTRCHRRLGAPQSRSKSEKKTEKKREEKKETLGALPFPFAFISFERRGDIDRSREMGTVANAELLRKVMKNCVAKKGWARAYFQAWLTASEMLQDRGYEIEDDDGSTDLLSYGKYGEFLKRYYREEEEGEGVMDLEELNIIASHRSDPTNKVVVNFLARHRNVNLGVVHAICDAFEAEDIGLSGVILVGHNCSLIVERFLVPRDNYTVRVEIFDIAALFENIVRYGFLLKYEMITEEEKRQLLSVEFKGTSSPDVMLAPDGKVFPVVPMSPNTMVAQYFALKKGDFC